LKQTCSKTLEYVYKTDENETVFSSFNKYIMKLLLDSSQPKQYEMHISIGEALLNCALGEFSSSRLNSWLTKHYNITEERFKLNSEAENLLNWLLDELLEYLENSNQHLRQAACFWLLVYIRKSPNLNFMKKRLNDIQSAFIRRLSENDEITQEVASKGISIVYNLANDDQKRALVSILVESLDGSKHKLLKDNPNEPKNKSVVAFKMNDSNEDSASKEQLGKTTDNTNLNTYKELCSLASDLDKPDLIYKFMNLIHHNNLWNTKKGAALGFNSIAEIASNQLQPYLLNIVPKLYRMKFDPNLKTQQSMNSLWDSIVKKDNKTLIDDYLVEIVTEIEKNMLSSLWRVRESCCVALCDLLKGTLLFQSNIKNCYCIIF
jgi:proteasome component ECM29